VRIDPKEHQHIVKLMSKEDQEALGFVDPGVHPPYETDHHAPVQTGRLERKEQGEFANWLMLNNYYDGTAWHRTDKPTGGRRGIPDFIVPSWSGALYIEFKLPGAKLSEDQEKFRDCLESKGLKLYVCYSAGEAIALVRQKDQLL
jgi:hypothetical protein